MAELLWRQRDHARELAGCNFIFAHQLTPEVAEDIYRATSVVFIDGACDGRPAGAVRVATILPVMPGGGAAAWPGAGSGCWQDPTPAGVLTMALDLFGRAAPAMLVTISVCHLELSPGLSPLVEAAVPVAAMAAKMALQALAASLGPYAALSEAKGA